MSSAVMVRHSVDMLTPGRKAAADAMCQLSGQQQQQHLHSTTIPAEISAPRPAAGPFAMHTNRTSAYGQQPLLWSTTSTLPLATDFLAVKGGDSNFDSDDDESHGQGHGQRQRQRQRAVPQPRQHHVGQYCYQPKNVPAVALQQVGGHRHRHLQLQQQRHQLQQQLHMQHLHHQHQQQLQQHHQVNHHHLQYANANGNANNGSVSSNNGSSIHTNVYGHVQTAGQAFAHQLGATALKLASAPTTTTSSATAATATTTTTTATPATTNSASTATATKSRTPSPKNATTKKTHRDGKEFTSTRKDKSLGVLCERFLLKYTYERPESFSLDLVRAKHAACARPTLVCSASPHIPRTAHLTIWFHVSVM